MAFDNVSNPVPVAGPVPGRGPALVPDAAVTQDSLGRLLLTVTARALGGAEGTSLDTLPGLSRAGGSTSISAEQTRAEVCTRRALAAEAVEQVDGQDIAAWIVAQYGAAPLSTPYPAVVIGSPHGSAAHLAATLGAPWLPSGFECSVRWPDGAVEEVGGALHHGSSVADRILAGNPDLAIRQVHDPVLRGRVAGTTVALFARWRRVPEAYRALIERRLAPGAPILLVSDDREWPALDLGGGRSFQLGCPLTGLEPEDYICPGPDLRQAVRLAGGDPYRWIPPAACLTFGPGEHSVDPEFEADLRTLAGASSGPGPDPGPELDPGPGPGSGGWRVERVGYPQPAALSGAVAEFVRDWLAETGRDDGRLVVECGRLLDPAPVLRAGMVPYWCEGSLRTELTEAEWWLAGSRRFHSVDVLVEPPGRPSSVIAPVPQWRAVAWFGSRHGAVDRSGLRGYPYGALPTRHASVVLGGRSGEPPEGPVEPLSGHVARLSGPHAPAPSADAARRLATAGASLGLTLS